MKNAVKFIDTLPRTYSGKLRNPVSPRYLCVKNNDLLYKLGFFADHSIDTLPRLTH
jgi:hypothetical protein